jgi:hypothetical protein
MDEVPMDKLAKVYRRIRDQMQTLTKDYETKFAELQEQRDLIASEMKDRMLALGSTSIRTDNGLVMLAKKTRYYTQDWDSFKEFVMQNDALDLFEKRIAQTNMTKFLEENPGLVPPGLNSEAEYVVSVRKPTK